MSTPSRCRPGLSGSRSSGARSTSGALQVHVSLMFFRGRQRSLAENRADVQHTRPAFQKNRAGSAGSAFDRLGPMRYSSTNVVAIKPLRGVTSSSASSLFPTPDAPGDENAHTEHVEEDAMHGHRIRHKSPREGRGRSNSNELEALHGRHEERRARFLCDAQEEGGGTRSRR